MSILKKVLMVPTFLFCLLSGIYCYAEEEYEDIVDITEANGKIYAFVASGNSFSYDLKARETVKWSDSRGFLGAYLTNFRFLVASDTSTGWQVFRLKLNEAEESVTSLSAKVALLVTDDRAIAFDATSNQFLETPIPVRDDVIKADTGDHVAVVVTSSRAYAMATGASAFSEIPLKLGESIEAIKITSKKVAVTTPDRLLIYTTQSSMWRKHKLN